MADSRWRMISFPFLVISYIIMTSLLLSKITYVLTKFLITPDTFSLSIFCFMMALYFKGNLDFANKFNNMTS